MAFGIYDEIRIAHQVYKHPTGNHRGEQWRACVVASAPQPEPDCLGGIDHEAITLEIPRVGGSSPTPHARNSDGDGFIEFLEERLFLAESSWLVRYQRCRRMKTGFLAALTFYEAPPTAYADVLFIDAVDVFVAASAPIARR